MGGILIKPKIIVLTKKKLMIYVALLLVVIVGLVLLFTLRSNEAGVPSSGYTYLKYQDGVYIGQEKSEYGNIKVEVTIRNEKIKDIKLIEMPQKFMEDYPTLKDDISQMVFNVIKTQDIVSPGNNANAYVLSKIMKSMRNALDQSLIVQ